MAKSTKRPPKVHPISEEIPESIANPETPFDDTQAAEAPAEPEAAPIAAQAPPPVKPRGRPPANPNQPPKVLTFFQRMANINPEDWGTRAKVRLYRLAPLIDKLRGSDVKFITIYQEFVDEERIKHDWGSGRYRLYLNYKMPQGQQSQELDQVDIDILDMKYPPVVPPGEWMDDPRNKQWAWGKRDAQQPGQQPGQQQQQPGGVENFMDMFRGVNEIRKEIKEEIAPPAAPTPATPPAAVDPWAAAERILNMRNVESPVVAIMEKHQEQAAKALEEERKRNHEALEKAKDREHELNQKLLELTIKNATPAAAAAQKGMLEQLMEFSAIPDKLDPIKKLFGWGSNGDGGGRPAKTTGMDLAKEISLKIIDSPIAEGLCQLLGNLIPQRAAPAIQAMNPAPNGAQPQQPAGDSLSQFIAGTVNPALMRMYLGGFPGDEFAAWMFDGYPERLQELQNFKHPLMPGVSGARVIIAAYKQSPLWPNLASKGEPAFAQFVTDFCAWKPGEEDTGEPEPAANGAPPVIIDADDMQEGRIS